MTNEQLEIKNALGSQAQSKRRLRAGLKALAEMQFPVETLTSSHKDREFYKAMDTAGLTFADVMNLQAYVEAINNGNIRAMEYIRDTSGEKPSLQLDMNDTTKGLSNMTTEEIEAHLADLKAQSAVFEEDKN